MVEFRCINTLQCICLTWLHHTSSLGCDFWSLVWAICNAVLWQRFGAVLKGWFLHHAEYCCQFLKAMSTVWGGKASWVWNAAWLSPPTEQVSGMCYSRVLVTTWSRLHNCLGLQLDCYIDGVYIKFSQPWKNIYILDSKLKFGFPYIMCGWKVVEMAASLGQAACFQALVTPGMWKLHRDLILFSVHSKI